MKRSLACIPRSARWMSTEPVTSSTSQPPPSSLPKPDNIPRARPAPLTAAAQTEHVHSSSSHVSSDLHAQLLDVVSSFRAPVRHAFAYGSGAFRQDGYSSADKPLLDFVFAVTHPSHWHSINLQQHPKHYSLAARMSGSSAVSWLQSLPAHMYFNVDCTVGGRRVKYGVIAVDALARDLVEWDTFYPSGRMQKPIHVVRESSRITLANQINLQNALRTALLLLPESFTEHDLYRRIAGLSYHGDFRMSVGENPRKIDNIVSQQMNDFRALYEPILPNLAKHVVRSSPTSSTFARDMSTSSRSRLLRKLPPSMRDRIRAFYVEKTNLKEATSTRLSSSSSSNEVDSLSKEVEAQEFEKALWDKIANDEELSRFIEKGIELIVARSAWTQSVKGFLSAGPVTSFSYGWKKLVKRWK